MSAPHQVLASFGAAAPAGVAYWNPADKHPNVSLSDSNKVALGTSSSSAAYYAKSVTSKNSGKWHVQFVPITVGLSTGSHSFGFATSAAISDYLGFTATAWGLWANYSGNVRLYNNNVQVSSHAGALAVNDIVDLWIDIDAGKAWWGKNGTVYAGDPVAGTGAMATFTPGTVLYLCAAPAVLTTRIRLRTDPAEMVGGTLSGFTDGWPA